MNSSCPFCQSMDDRIIADGQDCFAIFDGFPVTRLHALVIPRRHVADFFDLNEQEIAECYRTLRHVKEELARRDVTIQGFNVGVNSGGVAGQTVFHCHIHLIPRREGDVELPRGGVRNIIPGKGDY